MTEARRLPGAHVEGDATRFGVITSVGAPAVELVDRSGTVLQRHQLEARGDDYYEVVVPGVGAGALYRFHVAGRSLPDPWARFLPLGVHGPAQVMHSSYIFKNAAPARPLSRQVIYELHVGTFTPQGTFAAARKRLPALAELGVTTLELMPVAAFAGQRGWGYDGVAWFAPHAGYGTPDELRDLVDAAHGLGLSVLLDVVYNHFGPSGNYLGAYAAEYFHADRDSPWGKALRFEYPPLRQMVLENARYWLEEFEFDGLRLDATHAISDSCERHLLAELSSLAHGMPRPRLLIAEDERNSAELITRHELDALWADDFHHQLRVTLTGEQSGYYAAYRPSVRALAEVINRGWLYSGQVSPVTGQARGTPADALTASAFVYCIQNHDQVGNRALGERLSATVEPERFRAASLLLLFLPMTPLLFMGQEWGSKGPFLYFTDHEAPLGELVREGRRREFAAFPEFADPERRAEIPDPQAEATFNHSQLRWAERELPEHAVTLELYRSLLRLRQSDEVLSHGGREELLAAALDDLLIVQRWWGNQRRVLVLNLGSSATPLARLSAHLRLRASRALLRSGSGPHGELLPGAAVLLAGEGNLAGLLEGRPR
ncbi:MAG TPA: malto-oligosyltrehalose trehalohydrolase [Polyangiaceae bacterium]|nr:malto-oligosyltrehalose trehalohydrolase [Polyangiaceae bacterium]